MTRRTTWDRLKVRDWEGASKFHFAMKKYMQHDYRQENNEIRYYITSLKDVELCADAIRGHGAWKPVTLGIWTIPSMKMTTHGGSAGIHHLSILNKRPVPVQAGPAVNEKKTAAFGWIRKDFSWGFEDNLAKLLNSFDEKILRNALENSGTNKKLRALRKRHEISGKSTPKIADNSKTSNGSISQRTSNLIMIIYQLMRLS